MTDQTTAQPLTDERIDEYTESRPGDWYSGEWHSQYVDSSPDEMAHYIVKHHESGTVLAQLPDWAGPIALFIADAHDAVPALVAEIRRQRTALARVHEWADGLDVLAQTVLEDDSAAHPIAAHVRHLLTDAAPAVAAPVGAGDAAGSQA